MGGEPTNSLEGQEGGREQTGAGGSRGTAEAGSEYQAENPRTQEADHRQVMSPEG